MVDQRLQIAIEAVNNASKQLEAISKDIQGVGASAQKTQSSFSSMVGAVGLGTLAAGAASAAFGFLKNTVTSSIAEASEFQKNQAQLAAVLGSTGQSAGFTAEQINQMAGRLSELSAIDDDAIVGAQNMLLTFTNIKGQAFEPATQAVLDMATAMAGGGVPSMDQLRNTALQMGKALNDPIKGANALTKAGVTLTDSQKQNIETMVKQGRTMEAQKVILDELAKEFGGSAALAALTFDGKMAKLNNTIGDVKKNIGLAIVAGISPLISSMTEQAKKADQATASNMSLGNMIYAATAIIRGAILVVKAMGQMLGTFILNVVRTGATVFAFANDLKKNFEAIKNSGLTVFSALAKAIKGDFAEAGELLKKAFTPDLSNTVATYEKFTRAVDSGWSEVSKTLGEAKAAFQDAYSGEGLRKAMEEDAKARAEIAEHQKKLNDFLNSLGDNAAKGAGKVGEEYKKAFAKVKDIAKDAGDKMNEITENFTKKSAELLEDYQKRVAEIQADMAKANDDFNKSELEREASYQQDRLKLFMDHEDRVKDITERMEEEKKRLAEAANSPSDRTNDTQKKIDELQKQLESEKKILEQNQDLKAKADELRKKDDFQKLKEKYELEKSEALREHQEKMKELQVRMEEEKAQYEKNRAELVEETQKKYATLQKEVADGWQKIIDDTKLKITEMKKLEEQVLAIKAAIERARAAVSTSGAAGGGGGAPRQFFTGGFVDRPTLALIGEREPEYVIPASQLGQARSQGSSGSMVVRIMEGATINVTNQADERRLSQEIASQLARTLQGQRFGLATNN